jgi:hypothetical protein
MSKVSIETIQKNLESDFRYRSRRHQQWTDSYLLDRDTVITNRLTQRQSVNVPLMKETRKTLLAGTEEQDIYFENLDNDGQKELLFNEYWKHVAERSRLNILNEIDVKQEFLHGRSFWKPNIISGRLTLEVIDPQDVLDRYVNSWDVDSARQITQTRIFATLSGVERNAMFDLAALSALTVFFESKMGLVVAGQNAPMAADKAQKFEALGLSDVMSPLLGETYVDADRAFQPDSAMAAPIAAALLPRFTGLPVTKKNREHSRLRFSVERCCRGHRSQGTILQMLIA